MSKRTIYSILIPTATFILGILVQSFFDQWLTSKNLVFLGIAMIMVSLVIIFMVLGLTDKKFDRLEHQLRDIANRTGLKVDFIEDGLEGASYRRSSELIKNAKFSILAVDSWKEVPGYVSEASEKLRKERRKFYEALISQISHHQDDREPFHKRIIQLSKEYESKHVPFEVDEGFHEYIRYAAEVQESYPRSCRLRRTSSLVNIYFIIIDNRYVIMPILTFIKNERGIRHGALFFDDSNGDLVQSLVSIYQALDARSRPITLDSLVEPDAK